MPLRSRFLRPACTLVAALTLGSTVISVALPQIAYAEALTSDVVCGKTADERALGAESLPDITATSALVMGKDGTSYYERNADAPVKIASITKVMTAIVTLDNVSDLSETLTVDKESAEVGGSSANLKEGDTLTVEQALRGLMIPSGNDAAMALAKYVGAKLDPSSGDPLSTFVAKMNETASALGLQDTVFTNPHGLDTDQWAGDLHSNARDVIAMYAHAMENDTFRTIVGDNTSNITVTSADGTERIYEMTMHNELLGKDGNIGGKTGTTDDAGYCFVSAYTIDGEEIYMVVLHSSDDEQRYADTATLAAWFSSNSMDIAPVSSKRTCADGKILVARIPNRSWTDKTIDVTLADVSQTLHVFAAKGTVEASFDYDDISGNVYEGDKVGTVSLTQDGVDLGSYDLVADRDVAAPNPLEWVMVKFDSLIRSVQGRDTTAANITYAIDPELVEAQAQVEPQ